MTDAAPEPFIAPVYSASQITVFERCQAKWGWKYIDYVPDPSGPWAELGKKVHAHIERWLRDGTAPDTTCKAGEITMSALHLLPAPRTAVVEEEFALLIAGHRFRGFIDAYVPGCIYDHKTTGDLGRAKTPEQLRDDVQATLYAAVRLAAEKAESIELQWTYIRTRGSRKAVPVRLRVTRDEITPRLVRTCASVAAMTEILKSGTKTADLPKNLNACEDFGGCPYAERCLTPTEKKRMLSPMTQVSFEQMIADLQARSNGAAPAAPTGFPGPSVNTATATMLPGMLPGIPGAIAVGINPPPVAAPAATIVQPIVVPTSASLPPAQIAFTAHHAAPVVAAAPAPAAPAEEPAKPKRGRPKAAPAPTVSALPVLTPAPIATAAAPESEESEPEAPRAIILATLVRQLAEASAIHARIMTTTAELLRSMAA